MSNTAYLINCLTKEALSISDAEWKAIGEEISVDLFIKLSPMVASIYHIRKSLDFTKEAEQVAEEVTA